MIKLNYIPAPVPNFVVIPPVVSNPSGKAWRIPNISIRNRLK